MTVVLESEIGSRRPGSIPGAKLATARDGFTTGRDGGPFGDALPIFSGHDVAPGGVCRAGAADGSAYTLVTLGESDAAVDLVQSLLTA